MVGRQTKGACIPSPGIGMSAEHFQIYLLMIWKAKVMTQHQIHPNPQ